jgi:DNA primase
MCDISNTAGFDGYGETSGEVGDSADPAARKIYFQNLINKANSVPLIQIFKYYKLFLNENSRKTICPFKSHKGGRESSGSFYFYPETNSFYCFGCKLGGQYAHACEFVSFIENISKVKAAFKIFKLFENDVVESGGVELFDSENNSERLEIMLDFSNVVREFRQTFIDEKSHAYIEHACSVYDKTNLSHKSLDNVALRRVVDSLKEYIAAYNG